MTPCIRSAAARVLLWVISVSLIILLLSRGELVSLPGELALALMVLLVITSSLFWWVWVDEKLQGHAPRWFRAGLTLYTIIMLLPFAMALPGIRHLWSRQPMPVVMWVMIWYSVTLLNAAAILCLRVFRLLVRFCKTLETWWPSLEAGEQEAAEQAPAAGTGEAKASAGEVNRPKLIPRRAVLGWMTTAGSLAMVGAGMRVGYSQYGRFQVRRVRLALPRCPDRLKGLTITHLSDLHVGRPLRPDQLAAVVEAANRLSSDLAIVTGDIVDYSIDFLPAAADAIAQLQHRHGRLLVVGNHDLIDSGAKFVAEMARREPGFLYDEHAVIEIGGEKVQIAGLNWSHADHSEGRAVGHDERASIALAGADPRVFTIALAHHPHAFDALAPLGVDLTLAGHTHGGQFNLAIPGMGMTLSAGSLMFRYVRGEYRKDSAALFVNAGAGNWFPVRINAPAEIVQIQLV